METTLQGPLIGAIDQGSSSSRFLVFSSKTGELVTIVQDEISRQYPEEGWVEQDPMDLLRSVEQCIEKAVDKLAALHFKAADISCIGITNQMATTVMWDQTTGKPLTKAISWMDYRVESYVQRLLHNNPAGTDKVRTHTGIPLIAAMSAPKIHWIIDNNVDVRCAIQQKKCLFGNINTWLMWNLTGGTGGGKFITDISNAIRTLLQNVNNLEWDDDLCRFFGVPKDILPEIRSCSEIYGYIKEGPLKSVPISGMLGDQPGATVGQYCFHAGDSKCTYGTACVLDRNIGTQPVNPTSPLFCCVQYQLGPTRPVVYTLEGVSEIAGTAVRWLRDNLGIIETAAEIEELASKVDGTHGCVFVPAFEGLVFPEISDDCRGTICGLTQFTKREHIARATLEAVCFQTREILEAMVADSGQKLRDLKVDGGMTSNKLFLQMLADLTGVTVERPSMQETTALGAALVAGAADGINLFHVEENGTEINTDSFKTTTTIYGPKMSDKERNSMFVRWKMAKQRSTHWTTD